VIRTKDTDALFDKTSIERVKIIKNAFTKTEKVSPKTLVFLDDILTTGTTLKELQATFHPTTCHGFTIAYTK
jgi:predicted amidophosphoribosyltransferase